MAAAAAVSATRTIESRPWAARADAVSSIVSPGTGTPAFSSSTPSASAPYPYLLRLSMSDAPMA